MAAAFEIKLQVPAQARMDVAGLAAPADGRHLKARHLVVIKV